MNLEQIKTQTTWNEASKRINNNNARINEAVVRLENSMDKNKGYFKTLEELNASYPYTSVGSLAYVGTTYPFHIYLWNNHSNTWEDSGMTGGDSSINPDNIYMKSDIVWLTQEVFDEMFQSGTLDKTKEYRTYEED